MVRNETLSLPTRRLTPPARHHSSRPPPSASPSPPSTFPASPPHHFHARQGVKIRLTPFSAPCVGATVSSSFVAMRYERKLVRTCRARSVTLLWRRSRSLRGTDGHYDFGANNVTSKVFRFLRQSLFLEVKVQPEGCRAIGEASLQAGGLVDDFQLHLVAVDFDDRGPMVGHEARAAFRWPFAWARA